MVKEVLPPDKAAANKAKQLRRSNRYADALKILEEAETRIGTTERILCSRGSVFHSMRRYEEARVCFNRALELNPKNEVANNAKGQTYIAEGRYKEARACFDRALELNPKNEVANNAKGQTYIAEVRYKEARACFDRTLELNPKNEFAITAKGQTYIPEGKYEEARVCFDRTLELNPKNEVAITAKGQTYIAEGKYEEARACFDRTLELNPRDEVALYLQVKLLVAQNRKEEAKTAMVVLMQNTREVKYIYLLLITRIISSNDPLWQLIQSAVSIDLIHRAKLEAQVEGVLEEAERRFYSNAIWSGRFTEPVNKLALAEIRTPRS